MKLIRSAVLAGLAKVAYDQARKPENQQKIKDLIAQVSSKAKSAQAQRPAR